MGRAHGCSRWRFVLPRWPRRIAPDGDAQATLELAGPGEDVDTVVDEFLEKEAENLRVRIGNRRTITLGKLPAVRLEGRGTEQVMTQVGPQNIAVYMQMTFVAYDGVVYRLSLTSIAGSAQKYRGRATAFAMSFRPLDEAAAHSLEVTRLRIARALEHETLQALSERTRNALELGYTGVLNAQRNMHGATFDVSNPGTVASWKSSKPF